MGKAKILGDVRQAEELAVFCHTLQMKNQELHEVAPVEFDTLLYAFAPKFLIDNARVSIEGNSKAIEDLVKAAKSDAVVLRVARRLQTLIKRLTIEQYNLREKEKFYQVEQRLVVLNSAVNRCKNAI